MPVCPSRWALPAEHDTLTAAVQACVEITHLDSSSLLHRGLFLAACSSTASFRSFQDVPSSLRMLRHVQLSTPRVLRIRAHGFVNGPSHRDPVPRVLSAAVAWRPLDLLSAASCPSSFSSLTMAPERYKGGNRTTRVSEQHHLQE